MPVKELTSKELTSKELPFKESFVYLLYCPQSNTTYVGATVDLDHRLRQHNGEIKGGARITSAQVARGHKWIRVLHVSGFPTWQAALQFEWRFKSLSRKKEYNKYCPLQRRQYALQELLSLERSTSAAIPYIEWPNAPQVHMDSPDHPMVAKWFDMSSSLLGR